MTTISSSSSGGLDVNTLVTQLVSAERAPQDALLSTKKTNVQSDVSAWGKIMSALSNLQSGLSSLIDPTQMQALTATSSNTSVLNASVGTGAVAGNYAVQVNQLAQANKLASAAYADPAATGVGTGTLTLSASGNSFSVNITSGNDSLNAIRDAINSAGGNTSVTASIVQATDGAHLMLTSKATGAASQISVAVATTSSDTGNLSALAYTPGASSGNGLSEKAAAQDAQVVVDGFTRASSTNSFGNVIQGVTLNLASASPGTTVNVAVAQDKSGMLNAVKTLVSNYNSLDGQIRAQSGYNASTKVAGPLQGDSLVRGLGSQMRQAFMATVGTGTSPGVDSLRAIGISIDKSGGMSLDSTKLQSLLDSNPDAVTKLLSGPTGLATQIKNAAKTYTDFGKGLITNRQSSLQTQLDGIQKQQDALDTRMKMVQARYTTQFTSLNTMLGQMQQTSNYLTTQLANLG